MTKKNLNTFPYYDDFAEDKDFYQILFKPGFSVQARELTQLQSILKNQIKKFGDHVFKHGSVVIPGNSYSELGVAYIKVDTPTIDINNYLDTVLISASGVKAVVKHVLPSTDTDPTTIYVSYTSGSNTGNIVFDLGESLTSSNTSLQPLTIQNNNDSIGFGSIAYVNDGVFYVNGTFASVKKQSIVISKYTTTPSAHVLLKISEDFVSSFEDESLLDPSQGSNNFAAPGADRLKISLTLVTLPIGSNFNDDFIELMRYRNGVLEEHSRYPKYNELEKQLARRTFDESGDYLVNGFSPLIVEHLKNNNNGGYYPEPIGDINKFVLNVSSGKAYIQGFEVEKISNTALELEKARTESHIKLKENNVINPDYGSFFYVSILKNLPSFSTMQIVELWNDDDPTNMSAIKVGEARAIAVDYFSGNPTEQESIYKLYVTDLNITDGFSIQSIGGIRYTGASSGSARVLQRYTINSTAPFVVDELIQFNGGVRSAKVHSFEDSSYYLYKNDHTKEVPNILDNVTGSVSGFSGEVKSRDVINLLKNTNSLFRLPFSSIKDVKNGNNNIDIQYTVWNELLITTNASGIGSASISEGFINPIEVGGAVAAFSGGIIPTNRMSLNGLGNTLSISAGSPINTTIRALVSVTKNQIQPKTKTLRTGSLTVTNPGNIVSLGKADIYTLDSVVGVSGDITNRYKLDNGQRDFYYGVGSIQLVGVAPVGSITINFSYFEHSISGDYFCVDSYTSLGDDYISKIPSYKPKNENFPILLQNVLDFRPRFSDSGVLSGPTSVPSDFPVPEYRISTSAKYFVPRIDTVYIDKNGQLSVITGTPSITPRQPLEVPPNSMQLFTIKVPEFTYSLKDVSLKNTTNKVYKMKDVGKLDERLSNLENDFVLTKAENNLINYSVIDAVTGLDKYKSGFVIENFQRIEDGPADVRNEDFNVTYLNNKITAPTESYSVDLLLSDSSSNYSITGGCVTLPFTEEILIKQPFSSRINNVNPFLVINWEGTMTISPEFDFSVENTDLPKVTKTEVEQVVQTIQVERERIVPSTRRPTTRTRPAPNNNPVPVTPRPSTDSIPTPVLTPVSNPVREPVKTAPVPTSPVSRPPVNQPVVTPTPPVVFTPFTPAVEPVKPPMPAKPPATMNITPDIVVSPRPNLGYGLQRSSLEQNTSTGATSGNFDNGGYVDLSSFEPDSNNPNDYTNATDFSNRYSGDARQEMFHQYLGNFVNPYTVRDAIFDAGFTQEEAARFLVAQYGFIETQANDVINSALNLPPPVQNQGLPPGYILFA